MGAVLQTVPVNAITVHPGHPRLGPREELVAAIADAITGGLPEEKAVLVRPRGAGYELLDGKARLDAAVRAGLAEVPAWVKDLDDADALIEMVAANTRDELSPLEIGLHALTAVPVGAGGRGNKGGLSAYAAAIGKKQQQVSRWRQGPRWPAPPRYPQVNLWVSGTGPTTWRRSAKRTQARGRCWRT